jgi:hypothetical protein
MKSSLPPALLTAYEETDYYVSDDPPMLLKIGVQNDDARILLASFDVDSAAFITAWNPGSEQLLEEENDNRQAELLAEIEKLRLNYFVGWGEREDWREYSYLILGISLPDATALGQQFGQNAFVWLDLEGIPQLVSLV